jgi:hypothetical protein
MIRTWRVYFNKFNEAPLCWSIDSGTSTEEYKVTSIEILSADLETQLEVENHGSENLPCAWLKVRGKLVLLKQRAIIHGEKA